MELLARAPLPCGARIVLPCFSSQGEKYIPTCLDETLSNHLPPPRSLGNKKRTATAGGQRLPDATPTSRAPSVDSVGGLRRLDSVKHIFLPRLQIHQIHFPDSCPSGDALPAGEMAMCPRGPTQLSRSPPSPPRAHSTRILGGERRHHFSIVHRGRFQTPLLPNGISDRKKWLSWAEDPDVCGPHGVTVDPDVRTARRLSNTSREAHVLYLRASVKRPR